MKIIDLLKDSSTAAKRISLELYCPSTATGLSTLHARLAQFSKVQPAFVAVTCGASPGAADAAVKLAAHMLSFTSMLPLLHVTAAGKSAAEVDAMLSQARAAGIQNVLALHGEGAAPDAAIPSAAELIRRIRASHGDWFCIGAGAYPEGWLQPGSTSAQRTSQWDPAANAARKVQAGADWLLCQFSWNARCWVNFKSSLAGLGVQAPLVPGVLIADQAPLVQQLIQHTHVPAPPSLRSSLEKADAPAIRDAAAQTVGELLVAGASHVHLFTMNSWTSVQQLLAHAHVHPKLYPGALASPDTQGGACLPTSYRALPWQTVADDVRGPQEQVRPIHWANRSKSYILRTAGWQRFPTDSWIEAGSGKQAQSSSSQQARSSSGDTPSTSWAASRTGASSPAGLGASLPGTLRSDSASLGASEAGFAKVTPALLDFTVQTLGDRQTRRAMWGEPIDSLEKLQAVFVQYLRGRVRALPWCDTQLELESSPLVDVLVAANSCGMLTINSQPALNGVVSEHPMYGWGGKGGRLYQKAYVEFFASPKLLSAVLATAKQQRWSSISYIAADVQGNVYATNNAKRGPMAVTWGIFPGREVVQPTVVDMSAFLAWKEEAFELWRLVWADCYEPNSSSYDFLMDVHDTYYLITVVDHNFIDGRIWKFMHEVVQAAGFPRNPAFEAAPAPVTSDDQLAGSPGRDTSPVLAAARHGHTASSISIQGPYHEGEPAVHQGEPRAAEGSKPAARDNAAAAGGANGDGSEGPGRAVGLAAMKAQRADAGASSGDSKGGGRAVGLAAMKAQRADAGASSGDGKGGGRAVGLAAMKAQRADAGASSGDSKGAGRAVGLAAMKAQRASVKNT